VDLLFFLQYDTVFPNKKFRGGKQPNLSLIKNLLFHPNVPLRGKRGGREETDTNTQKKKRFGLVWICFNDTRRCAKSSKIICSQVETHETS
jgi:hypothetical protein